MENENKSPEQIKLDELKKSINTFKGKLTTLEEKKDKIEKETKELIAKTIYQKKQEIERSYDEVLREAEVRLKSVEKEKEAEKKKNLNKVVEQNTRGVREDNTYLQNEIKKVLKDNGVPGFVNSGFYMTIWYPKTIGEIFGVFVAVIVVFLVPTVLSFVVFKEKLMQEFPNNIIRYIVIALIYLGVIFIFGLIWLGIDKLTKKNPEALDRVVELRKNIAENKKKIEQITKDTSSNMKDEQFDYTKLDRDIEAGKIEVENYKKKRKEAIDNFVNNTQDEIEKKIEFEASKEINVIVAEMEDVKASLTATQKEYDELKLAIAEK
ncbi:MAG: hypothetical protein IJ790_01785 [Lachnospiraceae bacterium]|nr:hypothetical protein [Lachnospiraceae bacterium]